MKNNDTEFETLHSNKHRIHLFIGVVCVVVLLVAIVLNFTQAKYKLTESIPLINGTINYTPYDFKVMAMYQEDDTGEYVEIESMPSSGYAINEELSYCTLDNVNKDNDAILYTNNNGEHVISNLKKNSKCYLYFDIYEGPTAGESIITNLTISATRSGAITGPLTSNTTGTIYSVEDDFGTSYVYAGDVDNNWVYFAGFYWRIIRINGDGSIRMIYSGTSTTTTGTSTQITVNGSNTFRYNPTYGDNTYVGYMTGLQNECASTASCSGSSRTTSYSQSTNNTYDSNIKTVLDEWYEDNIRGTEYEQYISTEQGFCNDRSLNTTSETWSNSDTKLGYGTNATAYGPYGRLFLNDLWRSSQTPTLKCSQTNDYFTVDASSRGNHALDYPVGLITIDEIILAGGFGGSNNTNFWLNTNQVYWTMSPYNFNGSANVFYIDQNGYLYSWGVTDMYGVRPIINLDANITLTGSGTTSSPYEIS